MTGKKQVQTDRDRLLKMLINQSEEMLYNGVPLSFEIGISAMEIIATDMEHTELKCFEWMLDIVMENEKGWQDTIKAWMHMIVAARFMKHSREGGK